MISPEDLSATFPGAVPGALPGSFSRAYPGGFARSVRAWHGPVALQARVVDVGGAHAHTVGRPLGTTLMWGKPLHMAAPPSVLMQQCSMMPED